MEELKTISDALANEPASLRERILAQWSRLKAVDLITANQIFQRDAKRLDAKARASYKVLGMGVEDEATGDITTILGDQITQAKPSKGVNPWAAAALVAGSLVAGGVAKPLLFPSDIQPNVTEPRDYQLNLLPPDEE